MDAVQLDGAALMCMYYVCDCDSRASTTAPPGLPLPPPPSTPHIHPYTPQQGLMMPAHPPAGLWRCPWLLLPPLFLLRCPALPPPPGRLVVCRAELLVVVLVRAPPRALRQARRIAAGVRRKAASLTCTSKEVTALTGYVGVKRWAALHTQTAWKPSPLPLIYI